MSKPNLPLWCSISEVTGSYIAQIVPTEDDPVRENFREAARLFGVATSNFLEYVEQTDPIDPDTLTFDTANSWNALASAVSDSYVRSHRQLLTNDETYQTQLGQAMDTFQRLHSRDTPRRRSAASQRRYAIFEGQAMVKHAVIEGTATVTAALALPPRLAASELPEQSTATRLDLAKRLQLPATILGQHLARHSESGNDLTLKNISEPSSVRGNKILYEHLRYRADAFRIVGDTASAETLGLQSIYDNRNPSDLLKEFRGCPALLNGSVQKLIRYIGGIIEDSDAYAQTIESLERSPQRLLYVS